MVHRFIEAIKGNYIYFDTHHLKKSYFLTNGYFKIGFVGGEGHEIIKQIIREVEIFGQFTLERADSLRACTREEFEDLR